MMDVSLNNHNQDDFLEQFPIGSFFQSRLWRHFLKLQGIKYWQLSVYRAHQLVAHALLYSIGLPLGKSYLYAPKGPVILPSLSTDEQKEAFELILSQIRDVTIATRRREEIFCRLEPNLQPPAFSSIIVHESHPIQPKSTIYLELSKPQDELFASCKEKTRYNIRLAQKKGLEVRWSHDEQGLKIFLSLLNKSATRNKLRTHSRKHYEMLLTAGKEFDNAVVINWAELNGRPIAANLYLIFGQTMTYMHGGFNYRHRNLMAPYLLQWEALKFAYERSLGYFDFFGFTPTDGSKPGWEGFSRFKEGFGGTVVESPGCFDFVYNNLWYAGYHAIRNIKRSMRP